MSESDVLSQWAKLLPTGTFLAFKTLVPLVSNHGTCGITEQILIGLTVFVLSVFCAILTFTDSYVAEDGKLHYGIASAKGLWNPSFYSSGLANLSGATYTGGGTVHIVKKRDFVNAFLSVQAFATLALLSSQVTDCFYSGLPSDVRKAVPTLVAVTVTFIFTFVAPTRNGVGYSVICVHTSSVDSPDVSMVGVP